MTMPTLSILALLLVSDSRGALAYTGPWPASRSITPNTLRSSLVSAPQCRGFSRKDRRRIPNIFVFQSSIGIDSGTQLPASNFDATSSSTGGNPGLTDDVNDEVYSLASPLESSSSPSLAEEQQLLLPAGPDATPFEAAFEKDTIKKIFNALLLAASFGFAAYTILNIDSGMTRGWTQSEIAMRIPLDNWLNYESSLADRPVFTKTAINVIIYLLGDWLSQTIFAKKNILDFDAVRTLRNGFIGLCFGPLVVQYYQFSDHILPVEGGMWNRLEKILMDQTVYLTVKCSIYIAAVGFLSGDDSETIKTNVQTKLPKIVVTAWKFWPLVHLVTYGVIPARHRILWVNCVDLVWNAILAGMTTKSNDVEEQQQQPILEAEATPEHGIAQGVLVNDLLQVHQSDATISHTKAKDEDPFLLYENVVAYDVHSESLFDSQNKTATETMSS